MTQRTKIELEINKPTEMTLLYDEPITGRNQYGEYFMYAVSVGHDEFTYFATSEVHEQLSKLSKGGKAVITKLSAQRGTKFVTTYDVKVMGKETNHSISHDDENETSIADSTVAHDRFFDVMLNSYRDALEISGELNGLVDVHRAAITLYLSRCRQNNF